MSTILTKEAPISKEQETEDIVPSKAKAFSNMRQDFKRAKDAKVLIDKQINEWNDLYYAKPKEGGDPTKSRLELKEVAKAIEQQKPNVTEPFTSPIQPIRLSGRNQIGSRVASKYINKAFTEEFDRQKFTEDLADVMLREGTVWVRSSWLYKESTSKKVIKGIMPEQALMYQDITDITENKDDTVDITISELDITENRADAEVCRNEHIFPDPSARTESEMQFLAYRKEVTISDLRESKLYKEEDIKRIEASVEEKQDDTNLGIQRSTDARDYGYDVGFRVQDKARQKISIIEYWGYYDLNGDGIAEPIIAVWAEKSNVNLRLEENKFPQKNIPFHRQVYSSRPFSLWGNALAFFIGDYQRIKSGMVKGIMDNMSQANNAQKFITKGTLDYVNWKRMVNGGRHIEVNKGGGIDDGSYNDIPQSVFSTLQLISKESADMSGVEVGGGALNSANIDKADSAFAPTSASQQRMADTVRKIGSLMESVFSDWLRMANLFLTNEQIEELFSEEEQAYLDVLDEKFTINIKAGTQTNKNEQIKELNMLFQQSKVLQENAPPKLYNEMIAEMFDLFDKPDLAEELRTYEPEPSPMQVAQQEQQMLQMQLENAKLEAEIAKIQAESQAVVMKAQASLQGADNGRVSAENLQSVNRAKTAKDLATAESVQTKSNLEQAQMIMDMTNPQQQGV